MRGRGVKAVSRKQRFAMNFDSNSPLGDKSQLRRFPVRKDDPLQAWDAADELIVEHLAPLALARTRILIVGDTFGAISAALSRRPEVSITALTDSYLAAQGIALNTQGRVSAVSRYEELTGYYDLVAMRVPKNLSYFEDTLARISHHVRPGTPLVAGVMVKHQAAGAFDHLAKYYGETRTSLALRKARLIFAEFSRAPVTSPYPLKVEISGLGLPLTNHSNVFSREKLDLGSRFFLEHLPGDVSGTILDLGCGNGIIGIATKIKNPSAKLIFTDESRMAVESARANFAAFFPGDREAEFHWTNSYAEGTPASVDFVLCNPPFHQGNTVGDFVAREMFHDARRTLVNGGVLRVIGNSHLHYPELLKRFFGNSKVVAKNPKFTIVDSRKS